jgi:FkbM family methyltransferase
LEKYGVWEKRTTDFIKKTLRPGQMFLDVGAQVGYYSVIAADLGAKVFAYEPSKRNLEYLEKNTKDKEWILVIPSALSNFTGKTKLYIGNTPGENSLTKPSESFEEVSVSRYDDCCSVVPDMVKIDVEGAEKMVLEGMPSFLNTKKEVYLIIEDWYNHVTDWLIDNYGFKLITTDRAYGNRILVKNKRVKFELEPIRCHLLGTFNTPTTLKDDGVGNAFASKCVRMAKILKMLGHYVIFYGVEGSDVECDEFVQVSTSGILEKTYGKWEQDKVYGVGVGDLAHITFNKNAIAEINQRKRFGDFLLCCFGSYQKEIADAVKIPETIEIGIGYSGSFARFRIFESRFQMNWSYGAEGTDNGDFYDTVIPGYFEEGDFDYSEDKEDYYLYLGRVIKRKGVAIAQQVCENIGAKLIIAGFGYGKEENQSDYEFFQSIIKAPNVEYVGFAGLEKRRKLMSKARAVFMPTTYLEPFGYVALEAGLSGTPVITTDFGAFPETIKNGVNGYRCKNFKQFVWAAKNVDKIKPARCRRWVKDNYSMGKAAKMYQEYFEQILGLYGKGWYSL